jgi:two-component system phosphate regulon response regulator OmpR
MSTALQDPHLLVVDDDERLRTLLQRYLSSNGFRVSAAANAADARALMKSMAFDLLILDVMMPGESGFDLTKSVRANSSVPILMLTAKGEAEDRIKGLEHGADDYLAKPFEPRELLLRVSGLLRRAAPPAEKALAEVRMGECVYDPERGQLRRKGKPVHLTSSESALLQFFAANAGRSFSRTDR